MDRCTPRAGLKKAHPEDSESVLIRLRIRFLQGFIGTKLKGPLPKCAAECLFWEHIYSYYPKNTSSPLRFAEFGQEFLQFMLENRHFSEDYVIWIRENAEEIRREFDVTTDSNITSYDVKLYSDLLLSIIKENLQFKKRKTELNEYARFTVNGQTPTFPNDFLSNHQCTADCIKSGVEHPPHMQNRLFLLTNFHTIFGELKEYKENQEIGGPIGKESAAIKKLKLEANLSIERILKKGGCGTCKSCGGRVVRLGCKV
eukprot:TRINITY_DN6363_c0_g1_i2.p1 TRINITY_DN6363_c0_g1~~TRINITY_DN6363_c0_g1_i2.p1  ORF type:complete len:257 (-),score=32.67 TRINITY_DN6363_c0_g1_i2:262-1032(-)